MKNKNIEQMTQFSGPEESLGYLLWKVSLAWRSCLEGILQKYNLTHPQFVVLATTGWLTRQGQFTTQIEISRAVGLDPNTTSQILRGLEKKLLIKRKRFENERSKNPHLTQKGIELLAQAMPAVEEEDDKFFLKLTKEEQKELVFLFQKLFF